MVEETTLKFIFNESLSDTSIKLIKRILKESLDYDVQIVTEYNEVF